MDNQSIQHTRWNCTYHIVSTLGLRIYYWTYQLPVVEAVIRFVKI